MRERDKEGVTGTDEAKKPRKLAKSDMNGGVDIMHLR